jgi:hypothetical protein
VAILFPAAYLLLFGWDSGEHAEAVVLFGVLVSAILGVVWMIAWFACRRHPLSDRQAMFGVGASVGLAGSIAVGNMTDELASAAADLRRDHCDGRRRCNSSCKDCAGRNLIDDGERGAQNITPVSAAAPLLIGTSRAPHPPIAPARGRRTFPSIWPCA